ncbi:MAG: leucine--tRNA ligase [Candidatus Giovannonibacteria bacterium]|nr:MAG: leucine--tRNA ligase [Candidatus Giovannonibacteria bacterium]
MASYDHKKIEKKWQKEWEKSGIYKTPDKKNGADNFYALVEFPYPSGNLHTGHWYAFSVPDIFARKKRMEGKNVLFPIGFDAFGLPAENAAIQRKINPKKWTYENIDYMRKQIKSMGASFDWAREVITSDPEYYKWTQWIFLKLFEKGLAYQAETPVNWCPKDKTVLANEQVVGGKCERCGSEVVQKNMKQWMLKITDYAEKLLAGLEKLNWKEEIKEAQKNWIGKSEGTEIKFSISNSQFSIKVFTTRPDTLFGATYMVLAPEHSLIENLKLKIENWDEVQMYIKKAKQKTQLQRQKEEKEKTGVELKGVKAINPVNQEEIPIWIADYVLMGYGTGAIMAVPAHDQRDFEFANKFKIPVKYVIAPYFLDTTKNSKPRSEVETKNRIIGVGIVKHWSENKYLMLDWKNGWTGFITGGVEPNEDYVNAMIREIKEETGYTKVRFVKYLGGPNISDFYAPHKHLNQHVFGYGMYLELIDGTQGVVSDEEYKKHDILWVNEKDVLPFLKKGSVAGDSRYSEMFWERLKSDSYIWLGGGKLIDSGKFSNLDSEEAKLEITKFVGGQIKTQYKLRDWVVSRQRYWGVPIPIIHCEKCGAVAAPEKDLPVLLPEIKDYLPTGEGKSPLAKAEKWLRMKCPKCGGEAERETDTLDTFVDSSWYFLRYTDPNNSRKPFDKLRAADWMPVDLYSGGAEHTTMHLLYSRFFYKAMYDLGLIPKELGDEPYKERRNRGIILGPDGQKMSKSKGNVVDPDEYVAKFGADTVRMYLAFIGPYNEAGSYPWNPQGILGIKRFLDNKVLSLADKISKKKFKSREEMLKEHLPFDHEQTTKSIQRSIHKAIKKVSEDIDGFHFNTAISHLMVLSYELESYEHTGDVFENEFYYFLKLLAPFAPHLTEEIWSKLGNKKSIHLEEWPKYDAKLIQENTFQLIVQINGKVRDKFDAPVNITEAEAERLSLSRAKVKFILGDKKPSKIIFVPKRLINFVI